MVAKSMESCSFCKRSANDVLLLIQADALIYICNDCVGLCVRLLDEKGYVIPGYINSNSFYGKIFSGTIFLSYSSQNRSQVLSLATDLQNMNCETWLDQRLAYQGGTNWWVAITEHIKSCDLFIFALSPQSLKSQPCTLEYRYASALKKRILPILVSDVDIRYLPLELQTIQFIDYRQQSKHEFMNLIMCIRNLPDPQPLPNPLPLIPEIPIDVISLMIQRITLKEISHEAQKAITRELEDWLEIPERITEIYSLTELMLKRSDLTIIVAERLTRLKADLHTIQDKS